MLSLISLPPSTACRGDLTDSSVQPDGDDGKPDQVLDSTGVREATDSDTAMDIPKEKDFFFGYATASGHKAWRDLDHGSWYISELCRSLAKYARFVSLQDMMKEINQTVAKHTTSDNSRQTTECTSKINEDIFFF